MRSLVDMCLDLAWSQWRALGVSAAVARTPKHAIDLEALIAFTPVLHGVDARLYNEALDWCIGFSSRFVSLSRLRQVVKLFSGDEYPRFGAFAAAVNAYAGTEWPDFDAEPARYELSQKSHLPLLSVPSLAQLRARMVFGINARAEIVTTLLVNPPASTTASQLVRLGYTKRSLADTLDELALGGILDTMRVGNAIHYQLAKRAVLEQLLGPLPEGAPSWPARLAAVARLFEVDRRTEGKSTSIRSIELRKTLEQVRVITSAVGDPPPVVPPGEDPWPPVLAWLTPLLEP